MRILVTGANGYIGRHVTKRLLDAGCEVVACDLITTDVDSRACRINIDLFHYPLENIYNVLQCPDVCLHLAWRNGFVHNADTQIADISAHYNLLTALLQQGMKRLAVMSSMHEVGYHEGMISEDTPCNPMSQYGISKLALRQSLTLYCDSHNVPLQWLRGYYIVGDDYHNHSIFTKLCQAAKEGKTTFPFNSGKTKYDFLDISELSLQIASVVMQDEVNGIIECCSGKPVALAEKVEDYIERHGLNIKLEYGAFPDRPYDSPIIYGDRTKIERIMRNANE